MRQKAEAIDRSEAVWLVFDGTLPERNQELKSLFDEYQPSLQLVDDIDASGAPLTKIEGGPYGLIIANHRLFRIFWFGAYVIWDAYSEVVISIAEGRPVDASKVEPLVGLLQATLTADDPADVTWPNRFPEPGCLRPEGAAAEIIAAGEFAVFAAAWALLHELRHMQHSKLGTAAESGDRQALHREEFDCDEFAARFLLDEVDRYATETDQDAEAVKFKRRLGVIFGLLILIVINGQQQGETDTHPASGERLAKMVELLGITADSREAVILLAALCGLSDANINPEGLENLWAGVRGETEAPDIDH